MRGRLTRDPAREIWHYFWKTKGGIHIGNRGMGMYGNWLYFETPDKLPCVLWMQKTGKERWHFEIADVKQEVFLDPCTDHCRESCPGRYRWRFARCSGIPGGA